MSNSVVRKITRFERFVDTQTAAQFLGISERKLRSLHYDGKIGCFRRGLEGKGPMVWRKLDVVGFILTHPHKYL